MVNKYVKNISFQRVWPTRAHTQRYLKFHVQITVSLLKKSLSSEKHTLLSTIKCVLQTKFIELNNIVQER